MLQQHKAVRKEETVVQLQNGCASFLSSLATSSSPTGLTGSLARSCICCTLRGDLLEEVAALAEARAFDYLLIESCASSPSTFFPSALAQRSLRARSWYQRAAAGRRDVRARV